MTIMIRHWLAACFLLLIAGQIHAQQQIKIGIQAYRPKSQAQMQWAPLAPALNKAMPGYDFIIEVYGVDELADAVASRKIDFILTNPSQFVLMDRRSGLSAPLASLNNIEQGKSVSSFGGVIFTLANHMDIQKLEDVRGKSVAIISFNAFGGYQMQAYELHLAGLHMPQDIRLITTKPPQDNVVDAVLSGRADVGFVRSGVLESMAREGRLDPTRIKVINRQNLPGFPAQVSTRLYPEWFLASMPHTDKQLRRKVASFLLNIEEDKALTQALNIQGFDVPADYTSIEEMLRALRMPPFDVVSAFTIRDIWEYYRQVIIASFIAAVLLLLLGFRLLQTNRRLEIERVRVQMQADKLKESNNLFDSIVENIPNIIFLKRASDLKFELFNRAGELLLGCDRDKLLGISDYDLFPKEQANFFTSKDRAVLAQNSVVDIPEEPIETPNGTRILHTKKLTLRDKNGQALHLLGISEDITERKLNEEELRKYKDHLEEEVQLRTADLRLARDAADAANKAKSVFLSSMSHELRTPLNAILGFSSLLRKDSQLRPEQRDNLDIINRSGEHLLTLINDVLEMSKIEAGRVQMEIAPFDLGGMVRDVADMMHMRAQEKGLQLIIEQSSEFPRYIKGDEARMRQIFINLVGNAVKFTQQGAVTMRFGIKPHDAQHHLLIEIEDSGIGISSDDQQRLFQPFVQMGKQPGDNKGTGLGLTITRQFVELMGGTISVESTPGRGSIFRVELPIVRIESDDVSRLEKVEKGQIVGLAPNQPLFRILIVEDQLENQLLLSQLMNRLGLTVKVAENGEQGVQLFQNWHPHLIWMDRRMPVMDGIEATKAIRNLAGGRDVKIVAVTASAFMEQRDEMLNAGMDDFVRKPYRASELYECLNRQLGVQYIYAEAQEHVAIESPVSLTAEMLNVLGSEMRSELHDALESLESERIAAAIVKISSLDPKLHRTISRLAENFDYPAILEALQKN